MDALLTTIRNLKWLLSPKALIPTNSHSKTTGSTLSLTARLKRRWQDNEQLNRTRVRLAESLTLLQLFTRVRSLVKAFSTVPTQKVSLAEITIETDQLAEWLMTKCFMRALFQCWTRTQATLSINEAIHLSLEVPLPSFRQCTLFLLSLVSRSFKRFQLAWKHRICNTKCLPKTISIILMKALKTNEKIENDETIIYSNA